MPGLFKRILETFNRGVPTRRYGASARQMGGRYMGSFETDRRLAYGQQWRTYADLQANVAMISASENVMLESIEGVTIDMEPNLDHPMGQTAYDMLHPIVLRNPRIDINRTVRYCATGKLYGFAIQVIRLMRDPETRRWTIRSIQPREQHSLELIEDPDTGELGKAKQNYMYSDSVLQAATNPEIPRNVIIYNRFGNTSSLYGLGLYRQSAYHALELLRKQSLLDNGLYNSFGGAVILRTPDDLVEEDLEGVTPRSAEEKAILDEWRSQKDPFLNYGKNFKRENGSNRFNLSSAIRGITDTGANNSTSTKWTGVPLWDIEYKQADAEGLEHIITYIQHHAREIAVIWGTDELLLGQGPGSYALGQTKDSRYVRTLNGIMDVIISDLNRDLMGMLGYYLGIPPEALPRLVHQEINTVDPGHIIGLLNAMNNVVGVRSDDPMINSIRTELGQPPLPPDLQRAMEAERMENRAVEQQRTPPSPRNENSQEDE